MSNGLKVVLYDDELERAAQWKAQLQAELAGLGTVIVLSKEEATKTVRDLAERRKGVREEKKGFKDFTGSPIDGANVLIVDFDLFGFELDSQILTGEEIAQLARAYSKAEVIVVANQYGSNRFDLTLREGFSSHADLNVGGEQVLNPGLWKAPFRGYRPWSWPLLTKAVTDFRSRTQEVAKNLDRPMFEFLEFPEFKGPLPANLSRHSLSLLQGIADVGKGGSVKGITFRNFVCDSGTFIPKKEAGALRKHDDIVARLASAYVHKWLEYAVLPSQDVLVDVPHFLERVPWMLDGNPGDYNSWNSSLNFEKPQAIKNDALKYLFKKSAWLSRPALWWNQVVADEKLTSAPGDWNPSNVPDIVFREDISNFGPRNQSRQFVADVEGLADTRYVSDPGTVEVGPRATDPKRVEYSPSVRFAM